MWYVIDSNKKIIVKSFENYDMAVESVTRWDNFHGQKMHQIIYSNLKAHKA